MSNALAKIPIIGGFFDDTDDKAQEQIEKNQELYNGITLPNLSEYTPEDYQSVGDYTPEMAQYQTISEDPTVRSAQLSALSKMAGLADTGLSDVDEATFAKASSDAGQQSRAGTQAALESARNRGVGGSGLEFAMGEMANQGAQAQAQTAMLDRAAAAAQERALYTQAYGSGLSNLRSQDETNSAANANIINQFNQANTTAANQAQQYNLGNQQTIANNNTTNRNTAQQYNTNLQQQNFQNQMTKVNGQAGANTAVAGADYAQNAANTAERNNLTQLGMQVGMAAAGVPTTGTSAKK